MRPRWSTCLILVVAAAELIVGGGALAAQTPQTPGPLPPAVREAVLRFLNDPGTLRLPGGTRIPAGTRVEGSVGVLGGSLHLAGTISGTLVVVNGDLHLEEGARVEDEVLVIGGLVRGEDQALLEGPARSYVAALRFRVRGDRVELQEEVEGELPRFLTRDLGLGTLRLTLRADGNYNRVEGLPIHVGPLFRTRGRNPLLLQAFATWRSVSGLEIDRDFLGHLLRAEQDIGGSGVFRVGLDVFSEIAAIEDRGVTDLEASLTTFLLRRDFRDYYERSGWSAHLETTPVDRPISARLEYREEDHEFAPIRSPWTLRDARTPWRPQPLVAEGPVRTLGLQFVFDTRDDFEDPSDGWWIETRLRRRVGGIIRHPASDPGLGRDEGPFPLASDGALDLRRYNRLGPDSRLNLRLLVAGSLGSSALPPQFQRALGGEGSLPGHDRFAVDCGARTGLITVSREGEAAVLEGFPAYGCDRVALAQVQFTGFLPIEWSPAVPREEDWEWESLLHLRPAWTVFLNAGRGWSLADPDAGAPRGDSPLRSDVGAGIFVGPLGVYWAYPLNRRDRGLNFFVRLTHRF